MPSPILPALKESGKRGSKKGPGKALPRTFAIHRLMCNSWANGIISLHHSLLRERCKAIKSPAFKVIKEEKREREKIEMMAERTAQWQSTCPDGCSAKLHHQHQKHFLNHEER